MRVAVIMRMFVFMLVRMWSAVIMGVNPVGSMAVQEVGVVVSLGHDPLEEVGRMFRQLLRYLFLVCLGFGVRVEVEVVVQRSIGAAEGQDAMLARERAVVDVRRTPEVAAGGQIPELHHPGRSPDVVRLLRAIVE